MSVRRHTLPRVVVVVALAMLYTLVGPVSGADAVLTGLVREAPFTASTSGPKGLTARCPAGTRVIAAGADTTPGNGEVLLDVIRPNPDLTSVTVHANEDETGTAAAWYLQAFVICATTPAGLELVTATSPSTSTNKAVTATCPAGKRLLGNGARLTGAARQVLLDGQLPNPTLTAVTANAVEDETGTASSWSITAYAICANPVPGLQRVVVTGASDSSPDKVVTAPCPAGKSVIGMGGTINSGNGQIVLDAVFPDSGLTSATLAASEDGTGNNANWSLSPYAVCAAAATLVTETTSRSTLASASIDAPCPAGTAVTGVGADVTGGVGRVGLHSLVPEATQSSVYAETRPVGAHATWSLTAQAICTTPFPSQEVVSLLGPLDSQAEKSATVTCPAGTRVLGGGGAMGRQFSDTEILLQGVRPSPALTTVTVTASETEAGTPDTWRIFAFAVCASGPPGLQRVAASSETGSEESAQVSAGCPAGKHLVGTGGEVVGGATEVLFDGVRASADLTRTTVTGFEDYTGADGDWRVTAYAICINQ